MEIRITGDVYNPLLKRKEVSFLIDHSSAATPQLYDVRKALATKTGADIKTVLIRNLNTLTGTTRTVGKAEIYDSSEQAAQLVSNHTMERNKAERHRKNESEGNA